MNWIKSRIVEPTTWLAVGVGAILLSTVGGVAYDCGGYNGSRWDCSERKGQSISY